MSYFKQVKEQNNIQYIYILPGLYVYISFPHSPYQVVQRQPEILLWSQLPTLSVGEPIIPWMIINSDQEIDGSPSLNRNDYYNWSTLTMDKGGTDVR